MAWDRFKKLDSIGRGGMGQVWRAYDNATGAIVALKELRSDLARPKDMSRFLRETRHLKAIQHPNVIRLVAANSREHAYAMEYCPSGNLERWVKVKRPSLDQRLEAFSQICAGVRALHENERRI